MKTTKKPDHQPTTRVQPKRKLATRFRSKIAKFRTRVCEFQDDTPSSTVVRWLVVLLLIHIVAIGGVWIHGTYFKNKTETVNMAAALPAPPTVPQESAPADITAPIVEPVVATTPDTITKPSQVVPAQKPAPQKQPVVTHQPVRVNKAPVPGPARHKVVTGDSWNTIAASNNVSVADLKAVNPRVNKLVSGSVLVIPARPGEAPAPVKPVQQAPAELTHTVAKGETLSSIGRKYKIDWRKIMKHNKMTDKDVKRIRPGQKILIPAK